MTENKNKTTTQVRQEEGFNMCPRCGGMAYIVMSDDEYTVGCLSCGLRQGISCSIEEVYDDESAEHVRRQWNEHCLKSEYYEDALEVLKASNGSYILTSVVDNSILRVCDSFADVKKCVSENGDRSSFGLYLLVNGGLQYLGCSYLVWLSTNR